MSSSGRRSGDVFDYFPSYDASIEEDSDIEDGDEAHRPEDPESMGYLPLTCLNSDDEVEFAEQVDLRKTSTYNLSLGEDHDEVHDVDSSGSSSDEQEEPAEGETGGGGEPLGDVEMEIDHNYDNEDDGQGRISSGSHYLYARIDNDYDEEHIVESSSSEPSPRDPQPLLESQSTSNLPVYPTNNRNIYSRHYPSLSSHGTQSNSRSTSTGVDTGIRFNALGSGLASRDRNATFDRSTFGSSAYNYRESPRSSSTVSGYPVYNSQYGGSPSSHPSHPSHTANTVRGMNMPSTSTTDRASDEVKINMPGPLGERSSLLPGGVLHKRTSSRYTADIDVPLSNLDRRFPGASSESCSRPGYDSRQYYNNPSSLEAQIPGRSSASTTTTQSHSTRAHNSYGSIQTEIPPTDPAEAVTENSSLSKKKEKQKKRAEREKKSEINIQEVEGYVGNKQIDELLEFLGEETTDASKSESSKKKKDRKEKKKTETAAPNTERKRDKSNVDVSIDNRKRDNSMGSKRRESNSKKKENKKRTVKAGGDVTDNQVVTSSDTNSAAAAIIHTTNNRLVSRIILNGGNITSCSSESSEATEHKSLEPDSDDLHSGAAVQFSERNIDEAIAKSQQQQSGVSTAESRLLTQVESEETTTCDSSAAGSECKTAEAITAEAAAVSSINQQTIDVTYSIHLPDHYWVEEDFVRVKTPEPAEEEFKQVIHRKKKGHQMKHHNQAAAVTSTDSIRVNMDQCKLHSEQSEEMDSHACDLALPQQATVKSKLLPDRKAPSSHNQISKLSSPTMKALAACDNIKPYSKAATSCKLTPANVSRTAPATDQRPAQDQQRPAQEHRPPHYDMSESSFPTLATNDNIKSCNLTQSKVATVKPISWAHLASKTQQTMQQTKTKPPDQADGSKDLINKLGPKPEGSLSNADNPDKGALLDNKDTVQSDNSFKDICASNVIQAMNCPKPSDGRIMSSTRDAVVLPTAKTGERNETKSLKQSGNQHSTQKSRAPPAQKVQFGFGIGDPNSDGMNLMFGLDDEILQQTSLKSRTKVNSNIDNNSTYTISSCDVSSSPPVPSDKTEQVLQPNTDLLSVDVNINNKSELETDGQTYTECEEAQEDSKINMGVNILPNLLSMEETTEGDRSIRKVSHPPYLLKIIRSLNKEWDDIKKQLSSRNSSSRTRRVMYWTEKLD